MACTACLPPFRAAMYLRGHWIAMIDIGVRWTGLVVVDHLDEDLLRITINEIWSMRPVDSTVPY